MTGRGDDQASRLRALVDSFAPSPRTNLCATNPERTVRAPASTSHPPQSVRGSSRTSTAKVITIASGKGGVGKTNLAVNLSIALARRKFRVSLLDADMGVANADVLCGLTPGARLEEVLNRGGSSLAEIAVQAPGGFRLVPGSLGLARMADLSLTQREGLVAALEQLERSSEVIVIDASPGIGPLVMRLIAAADLALVVTTPEPTALTDAYALIKCVRMEEGPDEEPAPLALLVNNATDRFAAESATARLQAASSRFLGREIPTMGWIAHDPHVPSAVFARQPLLLRSPQSPAGRAMERVAGLIASQLWPSGEQVPVARVVPSRPSWLRRMIGRANA